MLVMTPWMFENLKEEIEKERRKLKEAVEERTKGAQSFMADNYDSGYHNDCQIQGMIQARLMQLESYRDQTQIIVLEDQNETIKIGNRAIIVYDGNDEVKLTLEGYVMGDSRNSEFGSVSIGSPVGNKIQNGKVGETKIVPLGGKNIEVMIKEILYPPK